MPLKNRLTSLFYFTMATVAFAQTNGNPTAQAIAQKSRDAYAALTSYSDTGTSITVESGRTNVTTFCLRAQRTNLFLLQWVQARPDETNQGRWWLAGSEEPSWLRGGLVTNILGQATNDRPTYGATLFDVRLRSGEATLVLDQFFAGSPSPFELDHKFENWPNSKPDQRVVTEGKVGNVDCYVLTSINPGLKHPPFPFSSGKTVTREWIGKQDFLVRQYDYTSDPPTDKSMTQIHENIIVNRKYSDEDFRPAIPHEEHTSSITLTSMPPPTHSDLSQTNAPVQTHKKRKAKPN